MQSQVATVDLAVHCRAGCALCDHELVVTQQQRKRLATRKRKGSAGVSTSSIEDAESLDRIETTVVEVITAKSKR